jgi:uncharacterized protein YkwD
MAKEGLVLFLMLSVLVGGAIALFYFINASEEGEVQECPYTEADYTTTQESSKEILAYVNELRNESGMPGISYDYYLYLLADKLLDDMITYNYYAYQNPYTDKCVYDVKTSLGFGGDDGIRESIHGLAGLDYNNPCIEWKAGNWHDVVDAWMEGGSSRENLMYAAHTKGAVACRFDKCIFLGLNERGYETKCY